MKLKFKVNSRITDTVKATLQTAFSTIIKNKAKEFTKDVSYEETLNLIATAQPTFEIRSSYLSFTLRRRIGNDDRKRHFLF